jgi:Cu/Ag efflux protein CusF
MIFTPTARSVFFARCLLVAAASLTGVGASCAKSSAEVAPQVYHATGTVKSFGPLRGYVNIAHEEIPGYMGAMTMSFEPQRPSLLEGLVEGDRIAFDFTETADARRVLSRVEKQR